MPGAPKIHKSPSEDSLYAAGTPKKAAKTDTSAEENTESDIKEEPSILPSTKVAGDYSVEVKDKYGADDDHLPDTVSDVFDYGRRGAIPELIERSRETRRASEAASRRSKMLHEERAVRKEERQKWLAGERAKIDARVEEILAKRREKEQAKPQTTSTGTNTDASLLDKHISDMRIQPSIPGHDMAAEDQEDEEKRG